MTRRFSRLIKKRACRTAMSTRARTRWTCLPTWPDVILIDGGQGQMTAVRAILEELGITDQVIAIGVAKGADREAGRERFFMKGLADFSLPPRDPVLYFVQRLRDGRTRFAIGSHPGAAQGNGQEPARRDRRHRPDAQARLRPAFRPPRPFRAPQWRT